MKKRIILGASIGNCVHVAGISHILALAENEGYGPVFLGPAVSCDHLFEEIKRCRPEVIGISYRLTPGNVTPLLEEISARSRELDYKPIWIFGGTRPVARIAKKYRMFSFISDGVDDIGDSIRFLRGEHGTSAPESYGKQLSERVNKSYPYPIIRHHFGIPSLEETITGVRKIAKAKVLDVISLGPDQNAQQYLFDQVHMQKRFDGAGGVPIRCAKDLQLIKAASQCGNYPLMRCYNGTEDVFKYAKLLVDTINNAWAAIPLFWYNELDGRGTRTIETSVREAQQLVRWHAERGIPVEMNEPHHWGLRDAHDVIPVVTAYIAAYNAKKCGVKEYISQYMFNNPQGASFSMDLARVLAMNEIVERLQCKDFRIYRETRAGLPLFHADKDIAKGQLAASTFMQMAIKPHIVHVVGFCEADHAAHSDEVIASCKIVRGVIRHLFEDDLALDKNRRIIERKEEILGEAKVLLDFICDRYSAHDDPLTDPDVLVDIVKRGYLDAVHILKGGKFKGNLATKFRAGKCVAYDKETKEILSEAQRLARLEKK